jgi:hypothetical protein
MMQCCHVILMSQKDTAKLAPDALTIHERGHTKSMASISSPNSSRHSRTLSAFPFFAATTIFQTIIATQKHNNVVPVDCQHIAFPAVMGSGLDCD